VLAKGKNEMEACLSFMSFGKL